MNKKLALPLLVVAALAAVAWNFIAFEEVEPTFDDTIDLDGGDPLVDSGFDRAHTIEPLDDAAVASLLRELPGAESERSPFLTRSEADELSLRGTLLAEVADGMVVPSLEGILWSRARRVVWLDGRPHSEGDIVGGREIESIARGSVMLRAGDARIQLELEAPPREEAEPPPADTPLEEMEDRSAGIEVETR